MSSSCASQGRRCSAVRSNVSLIRPSRARHLSQRKYVARAASEAAVDVTMHTGDAPGTVYGERGEVEKVRDVFLSCGANSSRSAVALKDGT